MLPSANRLKLAPDFMAVYKRGKHQSSDSLRLSYRPNNQNKTRFGFVVSRKHTQKIADRNRVKRVLRSEAVGLLPLFPNLRGYDIVIQARPGISKVKTKGLRRELQELLKKTKLLPK